ncbi:hypothetical protein DFQ27_000412 [Actinomortierella ambigua]|uniref:Uncharacterized protein n=1 Tax=Actinomortierella ambigua TaxID=1343610 RepID=A0A9P6QL91_9FUNG|nr:hypothetical protein DFQ27_000412 [Actinomortierella ambigua]
MRLSSYLTPLLPVLATLSTVISVTSAFYEISNVKSSNVLVAVLATPSTPAAPAAPATPGTPQTPQTPETPASPVLPAAIPDATGSYSVVLVDNAAAYPGLTRWDVGKRNGSDPTSAYVIKNVQLTRWVYYPVYGPSTMPVASLSNAADFDIDFFGGDLAYFKHRKSGLFLTDIDRNLRLQAPSNTLNQVWKLRTVM